MATTSVQQPARYQSRGGGGYPPPPQQDNSGWQALQSVLARWAQGRQQERLLEKQGEVQQELLETEYGLRLTEARESDAAAMSRLQEEIAARKSHQQEYFKAAGGLAEDAALRQTPAGYVALKREALIQLGESLQENPPLLEAIGGVLGLVQGDVQSKSEALAAGRAAIREDTAYERQQIDQTEARRREIASVEHEMGVAASLTNKMMELKLAGSFRGTEAKLLQRGNDANDKAFQAYTAGVRASNAQGLVGADDAGMLGRAIRHNRSIMDALTTPQEFAAEPATGGEIPRESQFPRPMAGMGALVAARGEEPGAERALPLARHELPAIPGWRGQGDPPEKALRALEGAMAEYFPGQSEADRARTWELWSGEFLGEGRSAQELAAEITKPLAETTPGNDQLLRITSYHLGRGEMIREVMAEGFDVGDMLSTAGLVEGTEAYEDSAEELRSMATLAYTEEGRSLLLFHLRLSDTVARTWGALPSQSAIKASIAAQEANFLEIGMEWGANPREKLQIRQAVGVIANLRNLYTDLKRSQFRGGSVDEAAINHLNAQITAASPEAGQLLTDDWQTTIPAALKEMQTAAFRDLDARAAAGEFPPEIRAALDEMKTKIAGWEALGGQLDTVGVDVANLPDNWALQEEWTDALEWQEKLTGTAPQTPAGGAADLQALEGGRPTPATGLLPVEKGPAVSGKSLGAKPLTTQPAGESFLPDELGTELPKQLRPLLNPTIQFHWDPIATRGKHYRKSPLFAYGRGGKSSTLPKWYGRVGAWQRNQTLQERAKQVYAQSQQAGAQQPGAESQPAATPTAGATSAGPPEMTQAAPPQGPQQTAGVSPQSGVGSMQSPFDPARSRGPPTG